jgi:hypothetical protein
MNLTKLFFFHSIITFAAGVVLFFAPEVILGTVGIAIAKSQYLICYFLGCAEMAIAFLSFRATMLTDKKTLQILCQTIIIFHLLTAVAESIAFVRGLSSIIAINIGVKFFVSILFWKYGFYDKKKK